MNLPIETGIKVVIEERNKQQGVTGGSAYPVSLEDLASEVQRLKGLGTWNSTTVKVVGQNVLMESSPDLHLLQDVALPSSYRPLLDIISKHVKALTQATTEASVQDIYAR